MFLKIVKNDLTRNKMVTTAIFIFITMAVILAVSAINNVAYMIRSMSDLQEHVVLALKFKKYGQTEILISWRR